MSTPAPTVVKNPRKTPPAPAAAAPQLEAWTNVSIPALSHRRLQMAMLKRGESIRGNSGEGGVGRKLGELADAYADAVGVEPRTNLAKAA